MEKIDVIVLGSGPGGYIAAIRASQLGKKVAIIEKDKLGGVCLNKGCIPTKALLKSAHSVHQLKSFAKQGIKVTLEQLDSSVAIKRASQIASRISKGVDYLMKKNKIEVIKGDGYIIDQHTIKVGEQTITFDKLIIATGAHYKTFDKLKHDGQRIIGAWEALQLENLPKKIAIIGAGAIGIEFAYFWNAFGVDVHIFEVQGRLLPMEDIDSSKEIERLFKSYGISLHHSQQEIALENRGDNVIVKTKTEEHSFELSLLAVGMTGNVDNIGLENIGITPINGFIPVNEFYQTSHNNIYAIGDVTGEMLLAHVASHQGVIAAEKLSGLTPHPLNLLNVPSCTYCQPQVASVGYREHQLKEKNIEYQSTLLPFKSNGKALTADESDGFVKILLGANGELLGAHIVSDNASELIHEYVLFKSMEGIDEEIVSTVHAHPTLGEWLHEAVLAAKGIGLNS